MSRSAVRIRVGRLEHRRLDEVAVLAADARALALFVVHEQTCLRIRARP
ncbi:hypothetical protein G7043_26755 [Lentzea sp. NEAU-D13]|uniref:Uncharacterized protein n=1 Tax=Lentzea alba TaxID=2714351 RepID=A0A7C9RTL8_9PSEU|nr:hypothetical protein [Lentzea alba]NGY62528.1 hypothetical protein [Lentzea alba]